MLCFQRQICNCSKQNKTRKIKRRQEKGKMYRSFLETVRKHSDKVAVTIVYNRPETSKGFERRRKGKKRKAGDRTFFASPNDLTWGQVGRMVQACQEAIVQTIGGPPFSSSSSSSHGTVLFCAYSGSFRLLVSWLATLGTGNTPVFVNPFSTPEQFERLFAEANPKLVFIEARLVNKTNWKPFVHSFIGCSL